MKFDVLTLFPEMYDVFNHSIIKRARDNGIIEINIHNIRDYTSDKHKKVDDYPYGGGMGMVMQAEPVYNSIEAVTQKIGYKPHTIFMSPRGQRYDQSLARKYAGYGHLLLICGHYEGVDERVMNIVDSEVSMGDFVLTGGELASMIIVDSVSRLIPGVLSSDESYEDESFYSGLLEYPQYTRPASFRDMEVPEVLLSGHHENIRKWRRYQSLKLTYERRPDLLEKFMLSKEDKKLLDKIKSEK